MWTGQSLESKFVVALGRAGLGCDRQILSQVRRLPDREDVGARLPRKQPAPEPYLANRARREHLLGNPLSGCFHPVPVACVPELYLHGPPVWGKREPQDPAL